MKKLATIILIAFFVGGCNGQSQELVRFSDTAMMSVRLFTGNDYKDYQNLTLRGKHIFDSLDKAGITTLQNDYLSLEAFYMKPGRKVEKFREIRGNSIFILEYLFWHKNNTTGYELKKEYEVK